MTALPLPMLTYPEVLAMPDLSPTRELVDGELFVTPAPAWDHQDVIAKVLRALFAVVPVMGRGKVLTAPTDVALSLTRMVQPDLLYIREERLGILGPSSAVVGAPDIVVEVLSPTSRRRDLVTKRRFYAEAGVAEYRLIDPANRTATVLTLADGQYESIEPEPGGAFRSRVLPDLVIDPETLFSC